MEDHSLALAGTSSHEAPGFEWSDAPVFSVNRYCAGVVCVDRMCLIRGPILS